MTIVIIDGQGGGVGKSLIEQLRAAGVTAELIAVGTNALATANMLRAGATVGATGENAVVYNCRQADIICGPIGIVLADSMYGELTPRMAQAVAASPAQRVFIPISKCHTYVAGTVANTMGGYLEDAVQRICQIIDRNAQE